MNCTTHYLGCACHEEKRNSEIAAWEARAEAAEEKLARLREQKPVAWMSWHVGLPGDVTRHEHERDQWIAEGVPVSPLYAPPQPSRAALASIDQELGL
jgi:hypothetical protein